MSNDAGIYLASARRTAAARASLLEKLGAQYEGVRAEDDHRPEESFYSIDLHIRKAFRCLEQAITCLNRLEPAIDQHYDLAYGFVFDSPRLGRGLRDARRSHAAADRTRHRHSRRPWIRALTAAAIATMGFVFAGCAANHALMPTPVLYSGANAKPLFSDSAAEDRKPALDVLFITDRAPAAHDDGVPYNARRSRSMAFGSAVVEFGKNVNWDELIKESTSTQRSNALNLELGRVRELGRFPAIPYEVVVAPEGIRRVPSVVEAYAKAKQQLQDEVASRLALAPRKEVVLFVHGYHVSFEDAALTMGELCHFLGRDFVCGIFTWPAGGQRGILFGYDVDRESAEYAVEDLVKAIRMIGQTPGVERVHLIAHSRGTDAVATALAQLSAEAYMRRSSPDREFHIANVVLIAPDLDDDVAITKIFKVFSDPDLPFGDKPEPAALVPPASSLKVTIYVSPDDGAIATATWLFGSIARLGRIDAEMLDPEQIRAIGGLRAVNIIQVHGRTDFFGHSYFVSNPRVSADIIAMLRYGLQPNDAGRPLEQIDGPFWQVLGTDRLMH